jgi:L-2,4-diaminobutyrate transaminase
VGECGGSGVSTLRFKPGQDPHRLVARKVMEQGVVMRALPFVEVTWFSPPLSITTGEIEGLDRYARGLEQATPELRILASG